MAKVAFTAARVAGFKCPADKAQAFMWDSTAHGLGLRTTPAGAPAYVFQGRYQDKTIRVTIGSPSAWSIPEAQAKARELQRLIDEGKDPRTVKAEQLAQAEAKREAAKLETVTVGEAWAAYMKARRAHWGERHHRDHERMSQPGGVEKNRGTRGRGVTIAGPVHPLLALRLVDLTPQAVEAWAAKQAKDRPTYGRLAWRCLKVFLGWCGEQPEYKRLVQEDAAKTRKTREAFGKPATKQDALQREQLPAWFDAVRQIGNPVVAAALQTMLLTGARPGEVLAMRWADVNNQWKGLTIRDKVEGERVIPLTPYVAQMLAMLPRRNEWVFSSNRTEGAAITDPNHAHDRACKVAGLDGLTLHGLRRSFASLTEWLEIPSGVVAQIMGHKPSATAEKHYKVRPLDLLRLHHERIEAWILEQAGVPFVAGAQPGKLALVAA